MERKTLIRTVKKKIGAYVRNRIEDSFTNGEEEEKNRYMAKKFGGKPE